MQTTLRKPILLLIYLAVSSISLYGQSLDSVQRSEINNYSIYATGGFFPIYLIANLNFEVKLASKDRTIGHYIGLKSSGGQWESMTATGQQFGLGFAILSGKKTHHLEWYIGTTAIFDTEVYHRHQDNPDNFPNQQPVYFKNYIYIWPATSLAYRYQKPKKPFLLRTGIGYPDAVFLSLGYSFN
jgi:hypothetical protein